MAKPAQPMVKYSPTLTPHRERSTQMVPDATMEGASIAKKIGKGTCMTVCVSLGKWGLEREGGREGGRERGRERFTFTFLCRGGPVGH